MSKIPLIFSKQLTSLTATELMGIRYIQSDIFRTHSSLESIEIPSSVEIIYDGAFDQCTALSSIEFKSPCSLKEIREYAFNGCGKSSTSIKGLDNLNPYCKLGVFSIDGIKYISNKYYSGDFFYAAQGKILIDNNKLTGNFTIPDGVVNLGPRSCGWYDSNGDTTTTSMIIPDTVEMIGRWVFEYRMRLTNITIGSSVRYIDSFLYGQSSAATLVFRQPAGMNVELPTPGSNTGLAYNKESRVITIYTDNECIKNYDWATDNATVTFYPLADAPT